MKDSLTVETILEELRKHADPEVAAGMAKVGIQTKEVFGVKIPVIKALAKRIGRNHELAVKLWEINARETRILACMIADYRTVSEEQLESWVRAFDFWEICDQCIMNLIEKTAFAKTKAIAWARREEEYVRRAGYVLMARLALGSKKTTDKELRNFLPIIKEGLNDERHSVKLAISWALRQIGKRNLALNKTIQKEVQTYMALPNKTAQWVAKDVLKDITRETVIQKLLAKEKKART